jgi:methyl-accepting chemotaxis protein
MEDEISIQNLISEFFDVSKAELKYGLEHLDESVIEYKGLMLKAKKSFREAKEEQLKSSYELWEKFDEELPKIGNQVQQVVKKLNPLTQELQQINELVNSINTHRLDNILETVEKFNSMSTSAKKTIKFLIDNYSRETHD